MIQDSKERTQFSTGAVRDMHEGKGRCDLMPLDVLSKMYFNAEKNDAGYIFQAISFFKATGDIRYLIHAVDKFLDNSRWHGLSEMFLEVSKHFEEGAKKYGENNWQKGIPVHSYIDSAIRHYLKYRAGCADEPHDRAFIWNLMCCIWTMLNRPEMDDFTDDTPEKIKDELA